MTEGEYMATLLFFLFVWAVFQAIKAAKRKPRKAARIEYSAAPNLSAKLAALESLQAARDTTQETIDYIESMFRDSEYTMKEKDILYWLKQKASAEKQLAQIESKIQKLIG